MGEKFEESKGRFKEAAGDVSGDKDLQREGKADQASASIKAKVGKAKDKLNDLAKKAKGRDRS